jgi:hypothetical protein
MGNLFVSGINSITFYARREMIRVWRAVRAQIVKVFGPTSRRWWENPLLHTARSQKPIVWHILWKVLAVSAAVLMLVAAVAWIITDRTLGVVMLALPLGIILLTLVLAPIQGVVSAASHFKEAVANPRQMSTADPVELVWGMVLVGMWRLRWLLVICLALTPAMVVSILHVDLSTFSNYRDSVIALGSAAPPDQVQLLGTDAAIPFFRLFLRAIGIGLIPYVILPLLTTLGVTATLALRERMLSQMVGLITSVVALIIIGGIGQFLSTTYLLGRWLEILRLILIAGYFLGVGILIWRLNILNAELLVNIPPDEGII